MSNNDLPCSDCGGQHHPACCPLDLYKTKRQIEKWMSLEQEEVDSLSQEDWEHYKNGGCLCFAHSSSECACGSWYLLKKDEPKCHVCGEPTHKYHICDDTDIKVEPKETLEEVFLEIEKTGNKLTAKGYAFIAENYFKDHPEQLGGKK